MPRERAGTASGLVNTARMVRATLGVAVLGLLFALQSGGNGFPPYLVGGTAELLGALLAFCLMPADALKPKSRKS